MNSFLAGGGASAVATSESESEESEVGRLQGKVIISDALYIPMPLNVKLHCHACGWRGVLQFCPLLLAPFHSIFIDSHNATIMKKDIFVKLFCGKNQHFAQIVNKLEMKNEGVEFNVPKWLGLKYP